MFSADLSWTDSNVEKVGERRERKARERSSTAGSVRTASSRSSVSVDRELWWTASLKKAKDFQSNVLRPSSTRSTKSQKTARSIPNQFDLKPRHDLKDATLQQPWTYSSTLSPTLPSGLSFDLPLQEVPELEGDISSRCTTSTDARFSRECSIDTEVGYAGLTYTEEDRPWDVRTPIKADTSQTRYSSVSSKTRAKSAYMINDTGDFLPTPSPHSHLQDKRRPCPVIVEGGLSFEALQLHDAIEATTAVKDPFDDVRSTAKKCHKPLSQWECLTPRGTPQEVQLRSNPPVKNVAVAHSSTLELTRFQRFIRRMESAGSRVVLDRLKEEWPTGEETDEELALEKQLWLLTGFQMQNSQVVPKPMCATGKILELYGNLSEVFQMSAMHPRQTIHFLTNKPQRPITLPTNVSYLTTRDCSAVPLPYPEGYFSHIRASTLPSLIPSSKLPELFRECYKLLASGGQMEVRVMDAAPLRKTIGPLLRMWIDDRLSVNLEKSFRCSKPCLLVPSWLADAGFDLKAPESPTNATLPCAYDESSADVEAELATMIGRSLWRDNWGSFVDDSHGEATWFWDDEAIAKECLERRTVFECRTIIVCKR